MAGFSRVNVPVATSASVSSVHSSSEPVHQWMRSGLVSLGDLVDEVEDALVSRWAGLRLGGHAFGFPSRAFAACRLAVRRWAAGRRAHRRWCRGVVVVRAASLSATGRSPGRSIRAPRAPAMERGYRRPQAAPIGSFKGGPAPGCALN